MSDVDGSSPRRRWAGGPVRVGLGLLALFALASAAAVAVPWLAAGRPGSVGGIAASAAPTPDAPTSTSPAARGPTFRCSVIRTDTGVVDDQCARIAADLSRRVNPPARQHGTAELLVPAVRRALTEHPCAGTAPPGGCAPDGPAETAAALAGAGFVEVTARFAEPDDPAPAGAVVFTVPFGPACVLGYTLPEVGIVGGVWAAGALPDGTCLAG